MSPPALRPALLAAAFIVAVAVAFAAPAASAADRPMGSGVASVEFLDVGQGDSVLVRSPEGKTALIDAGPSEAVVPLLRRRGVVSLDMVVVTHHHADHYGGMGAVIRAFHPRLFLATDSSHTTPHYLALLQLVRDEHITAASPSDAPRRIGLGSVTLWVFPQPPEDRTDENDNSIGVRVEYGRFSAVLTGDSEAGERAFWEANVPQLVQNCTVLKLAHHGSRNGIDARWLSLASPRLAVASLGLGNEFGHPHAETLAILDRAHVPLLRTDRDGTITVVSDGKEWGESVSGKSPRAPPVVRSHARPHPHAATRPKPVPASRGPSRLVDLNTATLEELTALPGIGEALARRIIAGRPYASADDLRRVKGIGEKRWAEVRPYVTAR